MSKLLVQYEPPATSEMSTTNQKKSREIKEIQIHHTLEKKAAP